MKPRVVRVWVVVGVVYASTFAAAATGSGAGGNALPAPGDLWDGVYTQKQADRGSTVYAEYCLRCHGEDLETARGGTEYGIPSPPLAGSVFLDRWKGKSLDELFTLIQTTMPKNTTVKLKAEDYVDVLAFLLQQNGFPAGASELPANRAFLKAFQISQPKTH
jgi:cytochrome c